MLARRHRQAMAQVRGQGRSGGTVCGLRHHHECRKQRVLWNAESNGEATSDANKCYDCCVRIIMVKLDVHCFPI